jgi:hypothetical protein
MKKRIFFLSMIVLTTACSSRRDGLGPKFSEQTTQEFKKAQMIDGQASRIQ